jgi:hypothetical protein
VKQDDATGGEDGHPAPPAPPVSLREHREAFEQRHPQVTITPSGATKSGQWEGAWPGMSDEDAAAARHPSCAGLLDYLEDRFGRGRPVHCAGERGVSPGRAAAVLSGGLEDLAAVEAERAALEQEHPGWHVWISSQGRWWATRLGRGAQCHRGDRRPMTVDADTAAGLRGVLCSAAGPG